MYLFRSIVDNGHKFEARVIPESLRDAHTTPRPQSVRTQWIPKDIHCYQVSVLLERYKDTSPASTAKAVRYVQYKRSKNVQFEKQIFEPGVQPMEFVSMDLIGEFHPPSSKGNRFPLTVVCMLTGYTFCIPIKNKSAEEIADSLEEPHRLSCLVFAEKY